MKDTKKSESINMTDRLIWLLTTALLSCFILLETNSLISYVLIAITLAIFILTAIRQKGIIRVGIGPYHLHVLAFSLFCLMSAAWAWNSSVAISKGITIIEILVCMSLLYIYYQEFNDVSRLIDSIKWAGYFVTLYTFINYGYSTIRLVLSQGERLASDFSNINNVALFSALSITIVVYQIFYEGLEINHLGSLPCILVVAASGTRKALMFVVIGCFLIVLQRYSSKNILKNFLKYLLILLIAIGLLVVLSRLKIFSAINERMEGLIALVTGNGVVDSSANKRDAYMRAAFAQFLHNPILGIGMDNCRYVIENNFGHATYSHNNYSEILCNGGIIGFLIYYSMHIHCLWVMIKYRYIEDRYTPICITLLIVLLIMDWGQVNYYSKTTYFYYMFFYLHMNFLKRKAVEYEIPESN